MEWIRISPHLSLSWPHPPLTSPIHFVEFLSCANVLVRFLKDVFASVRISISLPELPLGARPLGASLNVILRGGPTPPSFVLRPRVLHLHSLF